MEAQAQSHAAHAPISATKSASKFSSLRGIIRIPIKGARGNSGSNETPGGTNANLSFPHSHSSHLQTSRHNHQQNQQHTRSQSNDYTPPPSAFGNSPYGRHSRSLSFTTKPYMSQPMLGLGHTRDTDGPRESLDLEGDDTSSYSASPERSPIRQPPAAASAASLQRVAPWNSPSRTAHVTNAQTHSKSHSTPGRASNGSTPPVANGISSTQNSPQRPAHARKLSAQSISNAIVNTTHAGLAAIGVKTRRMSVDASPRPQIAPPSSSRSTCARMSDSNSQPSTSIVKPSLQDPEPESRQHSTTKAAVTNIPRKKAPSRPLPPEPNEVPSIVNLPLPATQTPSTSSTSKTPTIVAERSNPTRPKSPKAPTAPPHAPPSSSPSVMTSGPRSHTLQTPDVKSSAVIPQSLPKAISSQNTISPNYSFPPIQNKAQPNKQQMPVSLPHSKPPSGALAPAATTLTTSRNLPKLPSEASDSETRPYPPVKRSMTTGDESFRLHLPPINPRFTLHEVLESNSARLSPSVIFRPPPLPLINLPMLTPTLRQSASTLGSDGLGQIHRTRSLAAGSSASRRMMKAMPALPLQGTSRGTRGHEEVDDMEEEDEEDDMDEEDEEGSEEMSTEPHSASTGESSMDSETSTDDDGNSELNVLPPDEDHTRHSPSSRPSDRWRTMSRNKAPSRSSSYETARGGESNDHTTVEPSPTEPHHGRPERGLDKRFSRVPHLPRVETSGLELDFSVWDQKGMIKTPKGLNFTRVQEQQHGQSGVDKGKARAREGAVGLPSESEMRNAFFAPEDVFQTPIGGIEHAVQNRGDHGREEEWQRATDDAQSRVVLNGNETLLGGGGDLKGVEHDVTKSNGAAAAAGTSASPNGTISAVPGGGGMDYFYYRNVSPPQLPPLGPRRNSSRSRFEKTSGTSMPDMNHRISTTTTTTTFSSPTRGTSPLRTPRPSDFRLNVSTTTPRSPVLASLPPLAPRRGSEARVSVTMGTLTPHIGLYKVASRSLIDVHGLETKERVEKMMKDEEDAVEREHKTKKRNGKVQAKVLEAIAPPLQINLDEERDVHRPLREEPRTPPHSADPVMAGAAKRSSMLNPALLSDPSLEPPKDEEKLNRRISAAPAYDAIPHPLRRRRSMPTFNPSTAPPPYPDFSPSMYGLKRDLVILPRDDEGVEKLPPYSNGIYLRAIMPRKMEFTQPGHQAKDRKWRKVLCVLDGTAFKVYNLPAATGVSVIGEWWEKKVGAGDFSEPSSHAQTAGGTSGFRITTDTGRSSGPNEDPQGVSRRKSGEGGEIGAPVLQRNNSNRPQPSPPRASHIHGHQTSHSVAHASTRSALNLAVQLLKPSPRHGRSHSDVTTNAAPSHSPRASLNIPRSGRTTPTTSLPGSSLRSRSPSTHLTTPASSSASHSSRPTTPTSSTSTGAMSASTSSSRINSSVHHPQQPNSSYSKNKGKDKHDVPEPDESDLIRSYTMQHAESGLGKDYIKRQHVLRVRLEGQQFLLQANNVESVIAWIEGFQSAANVALDLDERPMPAGPIFPRRRRRRRPAAPAGSSSAPVSTVISPSPTIPNGPLAGVRPLERSAGRRS